MTTPSIDFSYSGDPSTSSLDEVRFLIQDTDATNPLFSDEEINYLINKWTPLYLSNTMTAAIAAGTLSNKFVTAVSVTADGVSVSIGDLADRFAAMAARLREQYQEEVDVNADVDITNIMFDASFDPTIDPLSFCLRLDDNMYAGIQEFGGYLNDYYPFYLNPLYGEGI